MPAYGVSFKDTVSITEGATTSGDKYTDSVVVEEAFLGQTQLTSQIAEVIETFGVPIVVFADSVSVVETHKLLQQQAELKDYVSYLEIFDISTSTLQNPETYGDAASALETIVIQANYSVPVADAISVNETHRVAKHFDYQTEDQYYYRPRRS